VGADHSILPTALRYPPAFVRAVETILAHEGGYSNDPHDHGGETRFGISKREYPQLDIAFLTREEAIAIYFRDWWQRFHYSDLPGPLAVKVFDLAVNIGPEHAAQCLQRALRACAKRVEEDGVLGATTRAAASAVNQAALMAALRSEAAGYYRVLAALERAKRGVDGEFIKGWLNRAYE
jgi:lysozyme family protein